MGKIFTSIMNSRLCDYLIEKGIITPEQCGFRKKHGTQDSIFILKALIDKYVKSKPKKSNNLLFTCFVDFSKTFEKQTIVSIYALEKHNRRWIVRTLCTNC